MSRLSESLQFVPVVETEAYGGAGTDSDAIDVSRFSSITYVFSFGDITGNSTLIFYAAPTAALAVAKTGYEIAFKYRLAAAAVRATTADVFGDVQTATSAGITLTAATYDNKLMLVEFDCDQMTTTNRFIVFAVSATANPMDLSVTVVGKPRYPGHTGVTSV
jgi:hypothetical protein